MSNEDIKAMFKGACHVVDTIEVDLEAGRYRIEFLEGDSKDRKGKFLPRCYRQDDGVWRTLPIEADWIDAVDSGGVVPRALELLAKAVKGMP